MPSLKRVSVSASLFAVALQILPPRPAAAQDAQILRIQINQAIAGTPDNPITEFVAGKNTAVQAVLSGPVAIDPARKTSATVWRGDQEVAVLSPKSYDRPTDIVDFLCTSMEACGNWAAGEYQFEVTVNGATLKSAKASHVFLERAEVRVLAIPVRGCYGGKDGSGPGVESVNGEGWKKTDQLTRFSYPVAQDKLKWVVREEFDASDCSRFDLYTDAGGANLWQALTDLMPPACATNRKADGCYDLIVGFVSRNPRTDDGTVLAGFTMGKPTNIVAASDQDAAATVSHEIAHVYGNGDTYKGGSLRCSVNPSYQGVTGKLWEGEADTGKCTAGKHAVSDGTNIPPNTYPYEVGGRGPLYLDKNGEPVSMADWMGTGGPLSIFWTTPETYRQLFRQLAPPPAQAGGVELQPERLVAVSGFINPLASTVRLNPWDSFTGTLESGGNQTAEYWIRAVTSSGSQLASGSLEFEPAPPASRGAPTANLREAPFSGVVPFPEGTASFVIMKNAQALKTVPVSANDPTILGVTPFAPAAISGKYAISWTGFDRDNDPLTYRVEYNADTGNPKSEWMILTDGLTNRNIPYEEDFDELPGGTPRAQIRVVASDGVRSGSAVSALFTVRAKTPFVAIDTDYWGDGFEIGDEVELIADVSDIQDEIFESATAVRWSSDRAGFLGNGASLIARNLPAGSHRISATAINSFGLESTAQATLNIGAVSNQFIAFPAAADTTLSNGFSGQTSVVVPRQAVTAPGFVVFTDTLAPPASSALPEGFGAWYRNFSIEYFQERAGDWTEVQPAAGLDLTVGTLPRDVPLSSFRLYRWDQPDPSAAGAWREVTADCQPASTYNTSTPGQIGIRVCRLGRFALVGPPVILNFPRLVNVPQEYAGLAAVNAGPSAANISFTALENNGSLSATAQPGRNPAVRSLAAGGQLAAVAAELFGNSLNTAGSWIRASSDRPGVAAFSLSFDPSLNFMDGADVGSRLLSRLIFPEASGSEISLVNPDTRQAAEALILLADNAGAAQGTVTGINIPAGGRFASPVSALFPAAPSGGYLSVTSSRGLAGLQVVTRPGIGTAALNALDPAGAGTLLFSPQFAAGRGYRSSVTLVNTEPAEAQAVVTWRDDAGRSLGERQVSVPAFGRTVLSDSSLFGTGLANTGYLRISSSRALVGAVSFGDEAGRAFDAALPLVKESRREMLYSHVAQNAVFYTGVAILNMESSEAQARILVYDREGNFIGSGTERIPPGGRVAKVLSQIVPNLPPMTSGYFKVISNTPVFSFAIFGTQRMTALAAIPPTPLGP